MRGEDKLCQNKFIVRWGRRLQTSMPPRETAPAHNWGQKHCQKIGKRPLFSNISKFFGGLFKNLRAFACPEQSRRERVEGTIFLSPQNWGGSTLCKLYFFSVDFHKVVEIFAQLRNGKTSQKVGSCGTVNLADKINYFSLAHFHISKSSPPCRIFPPEADK